MDRAYASFATAILNFAMEKDFTLASGFQVLRSLKNAIHSTQTAETTPPWVKDAKLACERLEMLLNKNGREKLKSLANAAHGIPGALDWIQSEKIVVTPGLQESVDVLKQAKLVQDIGADFEPPKKGDIKGTCQCVKTMLTLCSLQTEEIKFFFPESPDKLASFQSKVEAHMEEVFTLIAGGVRGGRGLIDKYRLGSVKSKMAGCYVHHPTRLTDVDSYGLWFVFLFPEHVVFMGRFRVLQPCWTFIVFPAVTSSSSQSTGRWMRWRHFSKIARAPVKPCKTSWLGAILRWTTLRCWRLFWPSRPRKMQFQCGLLFNEQVLCERTWRKGHIQK